MIKTKRNAMREGKRLPGEDFWVAQQPWLKDRGYNLRTRYQPDWVPSWKKPVETTFLGREDAVVAEVCDVLFSLALTHSSNNRSSSVIYWTRNRMTGPW
jgi:hypothetical protein